MSGESLHFIIFDRPISFQGQSLHSSQSFGGRNSTSVGFRANAIVSSDLSAALLEAGIETVTPFATYGTASSRPSLSQRAVPSSSSPTSPPRYVYTIRLSPQHATSLEGALKTIDGFVHIQPNYTYRLIRPTSSPIQSTSTQTTIPDEDEIYETYQKDIMTRMGIPETWAHSTGKEIRVAVLDTGIDVNHPEFCNGNAAVDPTGENGNGTVQLDECSIIESPYDTVDIDRSLLSEEEKIHDEDYTTHDDAPIDRLGHGTHVASIIAARKNGSGMIGTAYDATIIPIRVLYALNGLRSGGETDDIVNGIDHAITNNAHIINMSLGGSTSDVVLELAIQKAENNGVLVVAASGNENVDIDANQIVPAMYPTVLTVGAVDKNNDRAEFSNYGDSLDVMAVGVNVLGAYILEEAPYVLLPGTSMAAPFVSGIAALLQAYSLKHANKRLRPNTLRALITQSAQRYPTHNPNIGYGTVDAGKAMYYLMTSDSALNPTNDDTYMDLTDPVNRTLACYPNPLRGSDGTRCNLYTTQSGQTAQYWIYSQHGQRVIHNRMTLTAGKTTIRWNGNDTMGRRVPPGVYRLIVTLSASATAPKETKTHAITVLP